MKHSKRMILVPEDVYARFEQKQKIESSPLVKNMMNSDREMSDVLQRTDIPDSEKQKLYNANLERYMSLQQQKDSQIPKVRLATSEKSEDENNSTQETIPLPDFAIVDSMPKTKRQKATSILNRLKTRPDIISWDESGRVTLEGVKVPGSNISDLLSDAVKGRKNFNPAGSKRFFNVLSKINMPKDLVRNEERWKQSEIDNAHGEEVEDESSQSATPSKYFRSLVQRHEAKKPTQTSWLKY